ncbi:hypothetical protein SELMODRAFT_110508 [Selaginella moellendorffii]|uniref:NADP-dependent oxidoreductase domain-containing protein n=1 Tax=Selaginella moellendorffii TaxID=88036 RepID=D8S762_SELML|nr:auxin-induced protein PCNT115 [Selaginella moellendorffii]EFJ19698.1 hypothetical protein SELMODRAFT_110508 [Selaginella moellendorffii]|eukprot:XP_002979290.1 auxin-induced protein PCNT115 [Selaginella moellendorffii]
MAMEVPKVKLGSQGLEVSKQGLGCMGMSINGYGPQKPEPEMIDLIRKAVESGVTFLDTSDVYGPYTNEILVGKAIKGIRDKVQIATKFAIAFDHENWSSNVTIRGDPAHVRAACEASLKRLEIDCIDLYYQHRVDPKVPIEITVGAMKELVKEGKVKYLGLSEASAADIRRAHSVHPITAVQIEWSLWTRDVEEEIIPTCRELGIGIVSYSPLGRGFFSGKAVVEEIGDDDFRKTVPRFQGENLAHNKILYEKLCKIAAGKKCSPGQLALTWVQHQGDDVVPIPGTTKLQNFEENRASLRVTLSKEDMDEVESVVSVDSVKGERYSDVHITNTWRLTSSLPLSAWKSSV